MIELNPDKNRRILVIDDNRAIHDDFRKILSPGNGAAALDVAETELFGKPASEVRTIGYEVDSAFQGQEGLLRVQQALATGRPYAMAFVDVRMPPGWDGVETTRKIWEIDPEIQIVICTAYADYSWDEMFKTLGSSDGLVILKKPFDTVEALQLAQALTEKWWLHQQSRKKMEELEHRVATRTSELGKSLSLLNSTFESTADGIVVVNLAGEITSYNTKFAHLWQFPDGMLARRDAAEARAHTAGQVSDPAKFLQRINELQADPEAEGFDVIELKDGRIFERYVFPQRINGECVGTVINWRNITERKRAEEELSRKTAFLEAQLNSSIDGNLVVDQDRRMSFQNQRLVDLFKMPQPIADEQSDENRLRWVTDIVKYPEPFLAKVAHLYAHPEEISRDEIELKDGTLLDRYSSPVTGKDGKYYGRIWTFRDITESRRVEQELKQAKVAAVEREGAQRYSFLADTVPLILWTARPDGRVDYFNKAWFDYTGLTPAQANDWAWAVVLHPDDLQRCTECWTRSFKTGEDYQIEYRFKRASDGAHRWFLGRATARKNEKGDIIQWVGTCTDIDDQKSANSKLEHRVAERTAEIANANETLQRQQITLVESKRFLRSALDALSSHIAILDEHGKILEVNAAWNRFASENNFSGSQGVGGNYLQVCSAASGNFSAEALAVAAGIRAVISGQREEFHLEYPCHSPDEQRWFIVRATRFGGGGPVRVVVAHENITERKQAEAALQQSKSRLRDLIDGLGASMMVGMMTPDGILVEANAPALAAVGLEAKDVLGKPLIDSRWFTYSAEVQQQLRDAIVRAKRGEASRYDMKIRGMNDKIIDIDFALNVVRNETGEIVFFVPSGNDITERKQAENALRESNEKFHQLADHITDAFWIRSPDLSELHYVSPAFEKIWGRSVASLHADPQQWVSFILPEDRERVEGAFAALKEGARSLESEYRIVRPDGEIRWVRVRGFQVRDAADKLIRHAGIVTDITGRKKAEATAAAFSRLGTELSSVASAEDAARIISEAALTVLAWDSFAIQLYSAETGIMTPLFDVDTFDGKRIPGPLRPPHKSTELQQRIFQSGAQLILREPSGSFLPGTTPFGDHARPSASLLFVPVRSQACTVGILTAQSYTPDAYDQQDLRTLQTLADLCGGALERIRVNEALRKSEAQLFQSQKLETVGRLAGGIAHEFNSILTAIIGQGELLLEDLPAGSPSTENATEIIKAANRAATLTRQLLAYGRKQFLQPEELNLNQVIAGMDGVLRHLMGGKAVAVNIVTAAGSQLVKADAGQIEQVIMNLALNARDAMPNGGKLTLETANVTFDAESVGRHPELKPGDYVLLAVSDTGKGMSAEVKARAFEPFFTTKDVGQGTGLGLSTCYGIIKQSGGHLSVYSELGRGTTFKIYLPLAEAQAKVTPPRIDSPDLPRGTETILLVEDDPALRGMAAMLLMRLGYTVWTAANGVEALGVHHERGTGQVDLLFTDVVMPHMSGRELADRVRALYPHTRILFASAYTESAIIHQGLLDSGVALMQKPFTPSALARRVREILDAKKNVKDL